MRAIVFVGHGELPKAMMNSVQMIAGSNEDLFSVSLLPEDGKEEYSKKLDSISEKLKKYDSVLVFADLLGGSPSNAAVEKYFNNQKVDIISGMNLPMVLTAVMGDVPNDVLISEGISGIKDVKAELSDDKSSNNKVSNKEVPPVKKERKNQGKDFIIKNVRVDARGIHGQVATAWVPKLEVDRIIVIDDFAVKDEMQKMALKMAKPNTTKLSILSTKKAVERLKDSSSYPGEELLIIIQRIDTLEKLKELGYCFKEVNMGNVPNRPGTKAYRKTVNLTKEEVLTIQQLIDQGTHFTAQMVPNDPKANFDEIIYSK